MSTRGTLVVFGASGAIGREIVDAALRAGWDVRGFTRDATRLEARRGLTAVQGDATDPAAVADAIAGTSAVVNALGPATSRREEVDQTIAAIRNVEWTIARPGRVTAGPPAGRPVSGDRLYARSISAADLAAFMVEEIDRRDDVRGAPFVSG